MSKPKRKVIRQILDANRQLVANIEKNRGDGACFFRAVARAENYDISHENEDKRALELRQLACDYLAKNAANDDIILYGMIGALDQLNPIIKRQYLGNLVKLSKAFNADKHDVVARLKPLAIQEYVAYMRNPYVYAQNLEFNALQHALGRGIAVVNSGNQTKRDAEFTPVPGKPVHEPLVVEYNGVNHYSVIRFLPGKTIRDIPVTGINVVAEGNLRRVAQSLTTVTLAALAARDVAAQEEAELAKSIDLSKAQEAKAKVKSLTEQEEAARRAAEAALARQAAAVVKRKKAKERAKKVSFAEGQDLEQVKLISVRVDSPKIESAEKTVKQVKMAEPKKTEKPGFFKSLLKILLAPFVLLYKVLTFPLVLLIGSAKTPPELPPPAVVMTPSDEFVSFSPVTTMVPVAGKPVTDKPVTDKPVTDKPVTDKPVTDKPELTSEKPDAQTMSRLIK